MPRAGRHVHGPEPIATPRPAVDDDGRGAFHDDPVLRAEAVPLQADAMAGLDGQALHLVAQAFHDVLESAPGTRFEALRATGATRDLSRGDAACSFHVSPN